METILVIEADRLFRQMMKDILDRFEFMTFEATNGKRSVDILKEYKIDLVLLNLQLSDGNGLDYILDIRHHTNAPIIAISNKDDKAEKMTAFELGADDYICKPLCMEELIAHIQANLRRYRQLTQLEDHVHTKEAKNKSCLHLHDWTLDRSQFQLFDKNNRSCNLTLQEYQLIDVLMSNVGRPIIREILCEAVRAENYIPAPRAIDIKIARIRKKINLDTQHTEVIKTVRGVGYMFAPSKVGN